MSGDDLVQATHMPEAVAERKRLVIEATTNLKSPTMAARALGISPSNVTYWKKTDPEFRRALEEAEINRRAIRSAQLEEMIWTKAERDEDFAAQKFLIQNYDRENWGNQVDHKHSGNVFHTLIPTAQRLDELEVAEDGAFRALEDGS